jgi:hypothetical protein
MNKLFVIAIGALASLPVLAAVEPPLRVPEPGSLTLLALGLAGVVATRLRRK